MSISKTLGGSAEQISPLITGHYLKYYYLRLLTIFHCVISVDKNLFPRPPATLWLEFRATNMNLGGQSMAHIKVGTERGNFSALFSAFYGLIR